MLDFFIIISILPIRQVAFYYDFLTETSRIIYPLLNQNRVKLGKMSDNKRNEIIYVFQ